MANETLTTNIVRQHFQSDSSLTIEEQQTTTSEIQKLLNRASKGKTGRKGFPEFILQHPDYSQIVGVVECSAERKRHESDAHNQPRDFAVDGALWYAEHLRKEFDVIALGVSGETKNELLVSVFLCLKGTQGILPLRLKQNKLLPFKDYIDLTQEQKETRQRDYSQILKTFKKLNSDMHLSLIHI